MNRRRTVKTMIILILFMFSGSLAGKQTRFVHNLVETKQQKVEEAIEEGLEESRRQREMRESQRQRELEAVLQAEPVQPQSNQGSNQGEKEKSKMVRNGMSLYHQANQLKERRERQQAASRRSKAPGSVQPQTFNRKPKIRKPKLVAHMYMDGEELIFFDTQELQEQQQRQEVRQLSKEMERCSIQAAQPSQKDSVQQDTPEKLQSSDELQSPEKSESITSWKPEAIRKPTLIDGFVESLAVESTLEALHPLDTFNLAMGMGALCAWLRDGPEHMLVPLIIIIWLFFRLKALNN